MRQAFHIFRKDVRHLWLEICIAEAAVVGFTLATAGSAASSTDPGSSQGLAPALFSILAPLAWAILIARAIYGEAPAGEQPFWVTRPYSRTSLVMAKALFIAVLVNLPKLIGDTVILSAYGFPIGPELGGLLWSQVLLTAVFVLPIVALSTVTRGFVQLIIALFVLVLAVAGWDLVVPESVAGVSWLALEWTRSYSAGLVIAVAALAIIGWQYGRRDTTRSRFVAGGAVVLLLLVSLLLPWTAAFALQSRLTSRGIDISTVRVGFDPVLKWAARAAVNRDEGVDIQIPLRITGIPAGLRLKPEGMVATLEGPGGVVWRADGQPPMHMRSAGEFTSLYARLAWSFYQRVKDHPVRIRGSLYLTLYGNGRRTILPVHDRAVFRPTAGVGLCSAVRAGRGIVLNCRSALKSRPDVVTFDVIGLQRFVTGAPPMSFRTLSLLRRVSYSPFPAEMDMMPVTQSTRTAAIPGEVGKVPEIRAYALEPVAHIRRDFEITGLRLGEYETGR